MDRSGVQSWLDRYSAAWLSYDENDIRSLFAPDARYRYHPYDSDSDAEVGADAIVAAWVDPQNRDAEGTYDSRYEAYAVDGDRAVAVGWSRYYDDATKARLEREYHNVYLLRFDAEGRCSDFTELYMETPRKG